MVVVVTVVVDAASTVVGGTATGVVDTSAGAGVDGGVSGPDVTVVPADPEEQPATNVSPITRPNARFICASRGLDEADAVISTVPQDPLPT